MRVVTRNATRLAGGGLALLLAAGALACGPRAADPAPQVRAEMSPAASASAAAATTAPAFDRLLGRWARTDGGYVLEVRTIDAQGRADLSYLNPRPIHVEQALATRAGETLTLFVELQDVNYPGSSYNLAFSPAGDILEGTYFQAVEGQTYSVTFERR